MLWLLASLGVLLFSGIIPLLFNKITLLRIMGPAGGVFGCLLGMLSALQCFMGGSPLSARIDWGFPYQEIVIKLDFLSSFFLLVILFISLLAVIYGTEYVKFYKDKNRAQGIQALLNILIASMIVVVTAGNALVFLVAWETMALSSFGLVITEHENEQTRRAGLIYLIATHIGTAFLLVFFLYLAKLTGTYDFEIWQQSHDLPIAAINSLFLMALIGFGSKAGFMPFHVWLPEAHPAAPSHVSALMSGVMIKTGIYGLLRTFLFLGKPTETWGWVLIAIGAVSGVGGVLFAIAQHDLKKLLAYHSVENIGIIILGMGLGVLGLAFNTPLLILLGLGGALFHVLNHAIFKSLLFFGAGAIQHMTGTRNLEKLGGLAKHAPWIAISFLVGACAISALPPFNGFASEFLIYVGAFQSGFLPFLIVLASLALMGGLCLACFTKAFGIVFLGHPRSDIAKPMHLPRFAITGTMLILAVSCLVLGLLAPFVFQGIVMVLHQSGFLQLTDLTIAQPFIEPLIKVTFMGLIFILFIILFLLLRSKILSGKKIHQAVTWDCGYAYPSSRMQYTASSFAQPVTTFFKLFLRTHHEVSTDTFESHTPDYFLENGYIQFLRWLDGKVNRLRKLQHGKIHAYILYIVLTLVILLALQLRFS